MAKLLESRLTHIKQEVVALDQENSLAYLLERSIKEIQS